MNIRPPPGGGGGEFFKPIFLGKGIKDMSKITRLYRDMIYMSNHLIFFLTKCLTLSKFYIPLHFLCVLIKLLPSILFFPCFPKSCLSLNIVPFHDSPKLKLPQTEPPVSSEFRVFPQILGKACFPPNLMNSLKFPKFPPQIMENH